MTPLLYVSFAGPSGWCGGIYIEATMEEAPEKVSKVSPAGADDAAVWDVSDRAPQIPGHYRDRLLSLTDLADIDAVNGGDGSVVGGTPEQHEGWMVAGEAPEGAIFRPRSN